MLSIILTLLLQVNSPNSPTGNYLEARTASVFAGACHYNGEYQTTGHDAVMAWSIEHGSWKNIDLSNVRVAAAVSSDTNLAETSAPHRCEIQVDPSASDAQSAAVVDWLQSNCGPSIGRVIAVRRAPITFTKDGEHTTFVAAGFASADVQSMPNHECCKQPNLVWYSPLAPLAHRFVGYTVEAKYAAGTLSDRWDRADENSAFYGHF